MKPDGTLIVAHYPTVSSVVRPRTHDRHTSGALMSWQRPLTAVLLAHLRHLVAGELMQVFDFIGCRGYICQTCSATSV